jgi:hypothetical protein
VYFRGVCRHALQTISSTIPPSPARQLAGIFFDVPALADDGPETVEDQESMFHENPKIPELQPRLEFAMDRITAIALSCCDHPRDHGDLKALFWLREKSGSLRREPRK